MIKKQLGVLAGSVMLAASSQAAIDISAGQVLVVFNELGNGSYFELVGGVTADSVVGGAGFSVDLTSALGSPLTSITSFAVIGIASAGADGTAPASAFPNYNYDEFTYVETGGGLLFSGTTAPTTNLQAQNKIFAVNSFLANANLGYNGEGSLGDFDAFAIVADLAVAGPTSVLTLNSQRDVGAATVPTVLGGTLELSPTSLTFGSTAPEVPVPAAAWLFGSALLGLGVVRRKK